MCIAIYVYMFITLTILHRRCLAIAIDKVKIVPEYFKQFCSVLKSHKYFESLVTSLAISYIILDHERDIQEYIQVDNIVPYLQHLLNPVEICALIETNNANRNGMSRTEYFITLLKAKNPTFIETFMESLASDNHCPNHIGLYQLLKSLVDSLQETFTIVKAPKPSAAITKYQVYLKQLYTDQIKLVAQDSFESPHIEQYVNLSLITPEQTEHDSDYFKAVANPHMWLFKYKEKTSNIMLKSLSEIFDKSRVSREVILIQGSPGSGKTTLANEICRRWATGRLIQEYLLVILLRLRDPRIADMTNITELIYYSTTCDTDFAFEVSHEIECREGEGVLLVLEGWDELPDDKQKKSFFASIIAKGVFNNASVLVTSRPSSIGSIKKIHVTRNIAILGFSEDQIEQYLTYCLPDPSESVKSKLKQKFWAQLNSHLALKSLACIPVNLSILVHVFKESGERLPNSLTELYRKYIVLKLNHHNQRESSGESFNELDSAPPYISGRLRELGELAFYGLNEDSLTFKQEDIQKWCFSGKKIPLDYDGMGLLQVENHELTKQVYKTYTFLHRTIQEFLAAWYLKKIPGREACLVDIFDDKAFEMVWVFYAGLTGFRSVNINNILAANVSREKITRFYVKTLSIGFKLVLKNTASSEINRIATVAEEYYTAVISESVSKEFLLVLTTCCAEAQNPSACEEFSNGPLFHEDMCYIEIPDSALTSQMLSSLSYCITRSGKKWKIDCPHLSEQDILNLNKCFLDDPKNISGQLTSLVTYTGKNQIEIFMMLLQSQCRLAHLDLSGSNAFDDYCVITLAETLKDNNQLYILELKSCKVSSKGVLAIAEMLIVNDTLEWLNLKRNCFTSDDLSQVLTRIKGNTSIRLMEVDESLEQDVKLQLTEFNKGRQHLLGLSELSLMKGYKAVDWTKRKVDQFKVWCQETFD